MYLVTNRIATASSGPLSILDMGPNEQMPFDVIVFEVTRQDREWWLQQRARQTLDEAVCREIRHQVRDRGSLATLYPALRTALNELKGMVADPSEQMFLFSRCNDSPEVTFERGLALEKNGDKIAVCFSCPIDSRRWILSSR